MSAASEAVELIAQFDLTSAKRLRVAIKEGDDGLLVEFRVCALLSITSKIYMPTSAGFALTPDMARALADALQAALGTLENDWSNGARGLVFLSRG